MAHGHPDYGVSGAKQTVYQLTDLAELAARLGSPVTFDRRGDVIWYDDFEATLNKWNVVTSGAGGAGVISNAQAHMGQYSALLTAGSDEDHLARIVHLEPYPRVGRFGLEAHLGIPDSYEFVAVFFGLYTGTEYITGRWRHYRVGALLQYEDAAGNWVSVATDQNLAIATNPVLFHALKIVVDVSARQYVRGILNNIEVSLLGYPLRAQANSASPYAELICQIVGNNGANDTMHVDDVIWTQNEP